MSALWTVKDGKGEVLENSRPLPVLRSDVKWFPPVMTRFVCRSPRHTERSSIVLFHEC